MFPISLTHWVCLANFDGLSAVDASENREKKRQDNIVSIRIDCETLRSSLEKFNRSIVAIGRNCLKKNVIDAT